ncbi:hypothetical protein SDC9_189624 [bioreactor metagenome]|uniref:Uncharacterized protein n=1 Tax=bioreactor metagenome TaxID=1076179 RepID=A0A645HSP3_9ZZZZ
MRYGNGANAQVIDIEIILRLKHPPESNWDFPHDSRHVFPGAFIGVDRYAKLTAKHTYALDMVNVLMRH